MCAGKDEEGVAKYDARIMYAIPTPGLAEVEPSMNWNPSVVAGIGVVADPAQLYEDMHSYLASSGKPIHSCCWCDQYCRLRPRGSLVTLCDALHSKPLGRYCCLCSSRLAVVRGGLRDLRSSLHCIRALLIPQALVSLPNFLDLPSSHACCHAEACG